MFSLCYNRFMASVGSETAGRQPVPQKHGGAIWQGTPNNMAIPLGPGPGKPSKAQQTAQARQAEAFEAEVHRQAKALAKSAMAQFLAGSPAAYNALADRAWGKPDQKVEVTLSSAQTVQICASITAELLRKYAPQALERGLAELQERVFSPEVLQMVQQQDGGYAIPVEPEATTEA